MNINQIRHFLIPKKAWFGMKALVWVAIMKVSVRLARTKYVKASQGSFYDLGCKHEEIGSGHKNELHIGVSSGLPSTPLPVFKGEGYEFWKIRMKTIMISQDLWDFVGTGYNEADGDRPRLKENRKKDAKALSLIQSAVHDDIFSRIAGASTSKQAWTLLQNEYQGDSKVQMVKLQGLRREFETIQMKEGEPVADFLSKVMKIVNQKRSYGENVTDQTVVEKVLRSLPARWDHVVAAIEESKDLRTLSYDQLMGSLQAHEARVNRGVEGPQEEQVLQAKEENTSLFVKGRGRGSYRGRGRGRGRGFGRGRDIQCHNCKKFGHVSRECWSEPQAGAALEEDNDDDEGQVFMAQDEITKSMKDVWFLDSGCSNHMTGQRSLFDYIDGTQQVKVRMGNGKKIQVEGKGTIQLDAMAGKHKVIREVQYAPELDYNLLSVGQLMTAGHKLLFDEGVCTITNKKAGKVVCSIPMSSNNTFPVNIARTSSVGLSAMSDETLVWHLRYGHLNERSLQDLSTKGMVYGLPKVKKWSVCEGCEQGKKAREFFPSHGSNTRQLLDLVHADVCGPMPVKSLGGNTMFLLFTDDYSRMTWVYFLKEKSEVFAKFKLFKVKVELETGLKIKALRSDRGGEFISREFMNFCEGEGIRRDLTAPYTPEQNGVSERKNRTIVEMATCMLHEKNLSKVFWGEAVATAIYIRNLSPTSALDGKTPYKVWYDRKPSIHHLKVFGCVAYSLKPKQHRKKFDSKTRKCIFIGYSLNSKAYRFYDPETKSIVISRDVTFDELAKWGSKGEGRHELPDEFIMTIGSTSKSCPNNDEASNDPDKDTSEPQTPQNPASHQTQAPHTPTSHHDHASPFATPGSKTPHVRSLADVYECTEPIEDYQTCQLALSSMEPASFDEAIEHKEWIEAMKVELQALEKHQTWSLTELPEGKKAIGLKWVYKVKLTAEGEVQKHKARLVVKGYAQEYGVDYEETFSPVARFETVRVIISLAAQQGWKLYQFDVKSAFLNGSLQEEVYVVQPPGFEVKGQEHKVFKLHKALYGLKQAPRAWYERIDSYLQQHAYARLKSEPTVYVKKVSETDLIIVCLYVDDIIYTSSSDSLLQEFKEKMVTEFEMTDLGNLAYFLGLEISQTSNGIFLSQRKYARDILRKFGMEKCKYAMTPMNCGEKLQIEEENCQVDVRMFRSLVGGLLYLTHTRPELAYSVGFISRFMQNPSACHYGAAKRVLRYVAGTVDYGIWYEKGKEISLEGYTDSDWASSIDDRKSISANVFSIGSGAVTWSSKKQAIVALSSTEAEYVAATGAACQAVWLRHLMKELGCEQEGASNIWCDNVSAVFLSKNPALHSRSKHIDIKYHYIKSLVESKQVELKQCHTQEQLADLLTKALAAEQFCYLRERLGVKEFQLRKGVGIN